VAGAGVAARAVDLLEDQPAIEDAEAGAAVLLGDQRREVTGPRQLGDERLGVFALLVKLAPVLARVALADLGDTGFERPLLVGEGEVEDGQETTSP
jgi:hypothetical protein